MFRPPSPTPLPSFYAAQWKRVRQLVHTTLDRALPEACAACRSVDSTTLLCPHCCRSQTKPRHCAVVHVGQQPVTAFAPFAYTPEVRAAIHRLKFEGHPELTRRAARAMFDSLSSEVQTPAWWVPVPMERSQVVARGFNQSALLASEMAHQGNGRCHPMLLIRNPGSVKQSQLERASRLTNLQTAFDLNPRQRPLPVGSKVVLVDDVLTTGATAVACCKVLFDCGYNVAAVVTLAQVIQGEHSTP